MPRIARALVLLVAAPLAAGCGGGGGVSEPAASKGPAAVHTKTHAPRPSPAAHGGGRPSFPAAFVTEEQSDRLVEVDPRNEKVLNQVALPPHPEFVAADRNRAVVSSPDSGVVTVLRLPTLRPVRTVHLDAPHISEISTDRRYAYVTDDAAGKLDVLKLKDGTLVGSVEVGQGAHHMAVSPDGRWVWVALSESATTVVFVDVSNPRKPRVAGRLEPGFAVHDLAFQPNGKRVWLAAASSPDVGVFDFKTSKLLFRVPGGEPPQHVVFAGRRAYVTSGYGGRIELVRQATGHVIRTAAVPYGSFNLDVEGKYVATSSLLRGTLTVLGPALRSSRTVQLAPAARDVALSP